ncbi:lipopolysaccharide biosynthesis protein, partial [Mesorhizobium sp. M00.F.Ca.ET.149.01.1.1]
MTQASDMPQRRSFARIGHFVASRRKLVFDYFSAISGAGGRLVFSLAYFIALANTLSIAEFGMFATASAAGIMLSRILAFGFISALYRTATIRPNLIGTFTAGFLLLGVLSLPFLAAASYIVYLIFFSGTVPLSAFAAVVFAEALLWRP